MRHLSDLPGQANYYTQLSHVGKLREVREVKAIFGPHALKGQKLLAQGSALGYYGRKVVALLRAKALKLRLL